MTARGWIGLFLAALIAAAPGRAQPPDGKSAADWGKLLQSKDINERRAAAFSLSRLGSASGAVVKELAVALEDEDESVRAYSLRALGNAGPAAKVAVPAMVKFLRAGGGQRRGAAAALSRVGKDAVGPVSKILDDADPAARAAAAVSLSLMGRDAGPAGKALAKALSDDSFRVRRAAAQAIGLVDASPDDVLDSLVRTLAKDDDADVCRLAAAALGKLGKPALPAVMKALASPSADSRYHAAGALRLMGKLGEPAVKPLVAMLQEDDIELRSAAALALGGVGPAAVAPLAAALGGKSLPVRIAAAQALGLTASKDAVAPLVKALADTDLTLCRAAATALAEIGPDAKAAVDPLVGAMKDKNRGIREPATIALLRIGKESVPALRKVLKDADKDSELRVLAVVALGAIGRDAAEAVPSLVDALKDADAEVRLYAARALARIGPAAKSALKALAALSKDENPNVREAASEAINQISGLGDR